MERFKGLEKEIYNAIDKKSGVIILANIPSMMDGRGFSPKRHKEVIEFLREQVTESKAGIFTCSWEGDIYTANPYYYDYYDHTSENQTLFMLYKDTKRAKPTKIR